MNVNWDLENRKGNKYQRYQKEVIDGFESVTYANTPIDVSESTWEGWVTARFSPQVGQENILFLGDDHGNIGIYDVDKLYDPDALLSQKKLHFFPAHNGAIMDIVGVPHNDSKIVTTSGDYTARCWDLNSRTSQNSYTSQLYTGHEMSVRSISFCPNDPNIFITGARDGKIRVWDMRQASRGESLGRNSISVFPHVAVGKNDKAATPRSKAKSNVASSSSDTSQISVTSVVFIDDNIFASAPSVSESGIRLWDIRKPGHVVKSLHISKSIRAGVTCMSIDRFGSSLFALCKNNHLYEYAVTTSMVNPVRTYSGPSITEFYQQVACHPEADLVVVASDDKRALIYDVQDQHTYANDTWQPDEATRRRGLLPKWTCDGHEGKVTSVGWSSRGRYLMTLDEKGVRVWREGERKPWSYCDEDDNVTNEASTSTQKGIQYEKIGRYVLSESDSAMTKIDSMTLAPRARLNSYKSPQKATSSRGSKRPLTSSPFKATTSSPTSAALLSPRKKLFKPCSSPMKTFSPLRDATSSACFNSPSPSPSKESFNGARALQKWQAQSKKFTAFHNKYPTENLPNFVYEKFLRSLIGEKENAETETENLNKLTKSNRKKLDDWWQKKDQGSSKSDENTAMVRNRLPSVTEFGESACANVMSEKERLELRSPRKLVLKSPASAKKSSDAMTPTMAAARKEASTPRKTPAPPRRPNRSLYNYFKTPNRNTEQS